MEYNPYKTGYPPLERALQTWYLEQDHADAEPVAAAVTRALQENIELLIPLMLANQEEMTRNPNAEPEYAERLLDKPDGTSWLPLFTNREEIGKFGDVTMSPMPFRDLLELVQGSGLAGIVINPFGNYLELPKGFGEQLANQAEEAHITILQGDISKVGADVIVNAANSALRRGSGVCGALHEAAGPQLEEECANIGYCGEGDVVITHAWRLNADYVVHTVGPKYSGTPQDETTLAECYWNSLTLAAEQGARSIAFPAIGTGRFGFPSEKAVPIVLRTVVGWLSSNNYPMQVYFVLFNEADTAEYRRQFAALLQREPEEEFAREKPLQVPDPAAGETVQQETRETDTAVNPNASPKTEEPASCGDEAAESEATQSAVETTVPKEAMQSGPEETIQIGPAETIQTGPAETIQIGPEANPGEDKFTRLTKEMTDFIAANPTCFHVVQSIRTRLQQAGFTELREQKKWELQPGKGYFTVRGGSSVIAFRVPEGSAANYQIVAAHSDSPCFKLKENAELGKEGHYVTLNVEKYGGMLIAPWFDRPLSVAGRVLAERNGTLETRLVNIDRDLLMLPGLAIHMDRNANDGHSYQVQKEIQPLFGDERAKGGLMPLIAENAGVEPEQIVASDLFLVARTPAAVWGLNGEYVSSPRLDDQMCVFAALQAFQRAYNRHSVTVLAVFDNEEVGSLTKQGADSTFLQDVLERVSGCLGKSMEEHRMAIAGSFMVSADNGHAVHPNYPEKADPSNRPYMNGGVLVKVNANQKYTTDAVSAAVFESICRKAGVPYQVYVNHSDVPGGSTLGNLSNAHVSLNTIDIGAAQLAMHSPYETAGVRDTAYLTEAMAAFYATHIRITDSGAELL